MFRILLDQVIQLGKVTPFRVTEVRPPVTVVHETEEQERCGGVAMAAKLVS